MKLGEGERPNPIITLGEELAAAASATASLLLAALTLVDYGRGDIPNTVLEAAGTILGVSLSVIVGGKAVRNLRELNSPQTN